MKRLSMTRSRFALAILFIAVGALLWLVLARRTQGSASGTQLQNAINVGFRVGERAPDFVLRSLDGRSMKLSEMRGHPVLLNFWATWCAPCRVEMPWLVELDEKYRTQGLQIVGVSMDDPSAVEEISAFAQQRGVKYQLLLGNSATADAYGGVRFMPQSFFIDSDGKITKATTGLTDKKELEDGAKSLIASRGESQLALATRR